MGTKVHCESFLPGYYPMRDLNEDSGGCSWALFYGDNRTLANGQCYNGFPPRTIVDPYFGYEKDTVRRTILEHEAVFKSQVYELHRLYRIQRDMMDELKRKVMNRNRIPVEASFSSSPLASQVTYDDARKWQMPGLPLANSVCARPSMSVVEDNSHSPVSSRKGSNPQVGHFPLQNGVNSKDVELLEVRPVKIRKKLIDLHLPAEEYIDTEETTEFKGNSVCGTSSYLPIADIKTERQGDSLRIGSGLRRTNCLADLNEPFKAQETNGFVCSYPHDVYDMEIRDRKVWPPPPVGAGHYTGNKKPTSLFPQQAKAPVSSQPMQVLFNIPQVVLGFPTSSQSRTVIDLEADTSSHEVTRQNHLESSVASNCRSSHSYNHPDSVGPWNHLRTSRENPGYGFSQRPASAQVHPFLNSTETLSSNSQRLELVGNRFMSDSNSRLNPGCANSSWSNQNGFYHGSSSASKENSLNFPAIGYNYPNGGSGQAVATLQNLKNHNPVNPYQLLNGTEVKFARDVNLNVPVSNSFVNEVRKDEEHPAILPWLKPKPVCKIEIGDDVGERNPNTNSILNSSLNPLATNDDPGKAVQNRMWSQSLKSDSYSNNIETKKINASDCSASRKILGCPILDEPCCYKDKPSSHVCPSVSGPRQSDLEKNKVNNCRLLDINLPCDLATPLSEEERSTEDQTDTKVTGGYRCQIDLNFSVSEGEEDSFTPIGARLNAKVPLIDLEAPAAPESDGDDACGETKSPERPVEETLQSLDELAEIAAEAIVAISSSTCEHSQQGVACPSSPETSRDILHWFVETIQSYEENLHKKTETSLTSKGNEIDHFEAMTLQLTEMKEDEYMPEPLVPKDLKFEETSGHTPFLSQRPRRGNARRGRPRRDFQRDILPGLTSLSRHEVTEDLQTFGGLMSATGIAWTSGLTRRKTGSTRGRRRLITANASPHPLSNNIPNNLVYASPSVQHLNNNNNNNNCNINFDVGLEDRSLAGWGKTTRRPRRQRCPAGNRSQMPLT